MLDLAIKAGIPIIVTHTTDTINVAAVLSYLADGNLSKWSGNPIPNAMERVYFASDAVEVTNSTYSKLVDAASVLVIVNPADSIPQAFDAGEMPVPKEIIDHHLRKVVGDKDDTLAQYHRAVSGLTLKQMTELIRLAQAQYGYLDPKLMMRLRASLAGKMQGLAQVDTVLGFYVPDASLDAWVKNNRLFFLEPPDERLVPRGLMLQGVPGVGKTQGAKYIAGVLEVPLYRLDMASGLGKYVGESEGNLSRALATIDQEEPCVLLIDEVEKLFAEKEDSGVTTRLLAQLLWWLQEHTSRVLTVMTTNDSTKLPLELYRAGRIDKVVVLRPLKPDPALEFARDLAKQFVKSVPMKLLSQLKQRLDAEESWPHADVVELVKDMIKQNLSV